MNEEIKKPKFDKRPDWLVAPIVSQQIKDDIIEIKMYIKIGKKEESLFQHKLFLTLKNIMEAHNE